MRLLLLIALVLALSPRSARADCYVTWSCGSAACAQVYGSYSGRRGPFASCADFRQTDDVGHCSCSSESAPAAAPAGGAGLGGLTPQQQIGLQMGMTGAYMLGQGLHNALFGDPQAAAAERARQAALAEQRRQAALEAKQRDEQTKDRLLGDMLGVDQPAGQSASADEGSLRLLTDDDAAKKDPRLTDPRFKSPSFSKGYDAAERCSTQNVGSACADVSGEQAQRCVSDYQAGYEAGRKEQEAVLQRATRKGAGAAMSGLEDNAASDPDSEGDCRTQWIEAYHRGYFQSAHPGASRK